MSTAILKMPLAALAMAAAVLSGQSPVHAADLAGAYDGRRAVVHRERPRVVRTTYVRHTALECQTLKVKEYERVKFVDVCFRPLDLRP